MSAPTDRYAVIGHPIAHSRSPAIHAAFARQTGEPVAYSALLAPLDGFEATVRAWAAGGAKGCNVTVPFKFEACALCARRSSRAALAQAVNTIRFDADGWYGDNTDGAGLMRDIEVNAGRPLKGQRVLLIGAGGAAAGVLGPLMQCEPAAVTVLNRTPARAVALIDGHRGVDGANRIELRAGGLQDAGPVPYDVVINASSSSLEGAAVPVPATVLKATGTLAVDLMYGAAAAPFMAWAGQHGAATRDGLGMLVEQAAEAFALWRGVRPQTQEVIAMLRAALEAR